MGNITTNKCKYQMLYDFLNGHDLYVMIVSDSHTNSKDHNFVSDVVANEVTPAAVDGAYSRVQVTGISFVEDDSGDLAKVTSDAVTFLNLNTTENIGAFILYREGSNDDDSIIITETDNIVPSGGSTNILPKSTDGTDIQLTISQLLGIVDPS